MILNAEHLRFFDLYAFYRVVEKIYVGDSKSRVFKTFFVYGVAVVLRGYFYFPRFEIFYGVVSAAVTELQFICFRSAGKAYHLVSEANSEYRIFPAKLFNKVDKYLQDIVRDKRYWEGKRQTIRQREKHMEETIERYQTEIEDLQKSRKEILRKAKEEVEQLMQEANARIENTIRSIKEAQAEKEKTRQARQELTNFRESMEALANKELEEKIARKMEKLKEKQNRKKEKKAGKGKENGLSAQALAEQQARKEAERLAAITPGCNVRIKGQTSVGEVMEVNGKNAVIAFGSIKTTVKLDRLERTNAQPKQADVSTKSTFISAQTQDSMYEKKLHFKQDIDVRGMRGDEALQAVTYFIDDAILVGMSRVRILHGTGTGILRMLIRQYLETVPGVRHFADEHIQFGGAGITVVDLS